MTLPEPALGFAAAVSLSGAPVGEAAVAALIGGMAGCVVLILLTDYVRYRRDLRWWRRHDKDKGGKPTRGPGASGP